MKYKRRNSKGIFISNKKAKAKSKCNTCGKTIYDYKYRKRKYCNKTCAYKSFEIRYKGINNHFYGSKHTEETKQKIIEYNTGRKRTPESIEKFVKKISGKKHYKWIKDRTKISSRDRNNKSKTWAKQIKKKYNYICCICHKKGGELNSHHIKSWKEYPDVRYNLDNGITLCTDCHRWVHNINVMNMQ